MPPDSLEPWLLAILETWRDATPDSLVEPWDWYYLVGRASRALSPRIPRERLAALNAAVWRSLGADVDALRVHYDLEPREGKDPVAFTTFGGARTPIEPWVFATYRTGGLDNLNELLHETGHAVHLAAIRTRPAFRDWPDSDPFTEAVADFVALDVYEPAWQQRWLGDSVPLADGAPGPLRRHRARRGLGAVRAADAPRAGRRSQRRSGPRSPATTSASAATPSSPGGPCGASWWTRRAT